MMQDVDNLEKVRKLVEDVCRGSVPEYVNLQDLKRDLDRFAAGLRSDDVTARHYPTRESNTNREFDELARHADGILASFETESLRYRNIPDDFCIVDKDKLLTQLRLLAHWARNEASSVKGSARKILGYLNGPHSKICFSLAPIYERHFKRRPGVSEIAGRATGPFVRFALYALNEHDTESGRPKIAAGTVKKAWSEGKKHYSFDVATGAISIKGNPLQPRKRASSRRHGAHERD
jgi:hypothetical protein